MDNQGYSFAAKLDELKSKGLMLVRGFQRPILLIYSDGNVFGLDNRCPHMGFPLEKGSVDDGILTCHWHHARFDVASGCTFDLWADDIPCCPTKLIDDEVWVKPDFDQSDSLAHWEKRLTDGMAHNLSLIIAKSVYGLRAAKATPKEILRQSALYGARNRDNWNTGLTILTALGNILPELSDDEISLALFQGIRHLAMDCAGQPQRVERSPLSSSPRLATLKSWFRHWNRVRHREAAERTLLTAIASGASKSEIADMLFAAETDRMYADAGHSLDFINKALECLELIGWDNAKQILPTIVDQMISARGAEESTAWRQPVDLVELLEKTFLTLPDLITSSQINSSWGNHSELATELLADDPTSIIEALKSAIVSGACLSDLGRSLTLAAAQRLAQFGTANEHSDWETAHHTFTYCNAVHQALLIIEKHTGEAGDYVDAVRGVFHGSMAIYLIRYLNVPPAKLPSEDDKLLNLLPSDPHELCEQLLDAFSQQRQIEAASQIICRYLYLNNDPKQLIVTLAQAVLREDAGFHTYQMLESGIRQFLDWGNSDQGRIILVGMTRYLAAHSPTERATYQTVDIARRLMRGGILHEDFDE